MARRRPLMQQLLREKLRRLVHSIIIEDLGHVKGASRGWGATSTRVVGSDRVMLGDTEAKDEGSTTQMTPVKVSRAFLRAQALDDPTDA